MVVILDKKLRKELDKEEENYIWIWCNVKSCPESKRVLWNGKFIDKWYCEKHKGREEGY